MAETPGYVGAIVAATAAHRRSQASCFQGRTVNWGELLDRAARIAAGLRAHGVQDGDRIAVLSANSDLYMVLYLAIPWAGGVLAPLNVRWSVAENAFAIADCKPALAFVGAGLAESSASLFADRATGPTPVALDDVVRAGWLTLSDLLAHEPMQDAGRAGDDLLAIFYTGGTTGRPKGVMLSHAGLTRNCMAMRDLGIGRTGCRMLIAAPLFHLAAAAMLTVTMLAGGTAVIEAAFDPVRAPDAIANAPVTEALLVPTMVQMLLDAPGFDPQKLSTLNTIIYGASPMPEATLDRIMAAVPHADLFQAYGMTEVSCTATVLSPDYHRGAHRAAGRHRGAGLPIAIAEVMIADPQGQSVPTGEVGEILVRGAGVMLGYWNQPELTASALREGWMHTGDGGRLDDHGVLYVVDRIKDMIVSGGENVYSAEVENALALHPAVAACAVIGVPSAQWGEAVHAVVVRKPGRDVSADDLLAHCRSLIAGYKCPRSVEFAQGLPLSGAGKILKAKLREPFWQGRERGIA